MAMTDQIIYKISHLANSNLDGWLLDQCVIIKNGIISDIIHRDKLNKDLISNSKVVSLGDGYMLPGLIETHAHFQFSATSNAYDIYFKENPAQLMDRAKKNAKTALLSGVTTVRELGAPNDLIFPLKNNIDQNKILGPDILPTGTPITIENGHCWFFGSVATTTNEIFNVIENQLSLGATHIKIMASGGYFTPSSNPRIAQYSPSVIKDVVNFCEKNGTYLCAHTLSAESTSACIDGGVHNVIHGRWFDSSVEKSYSFDDKYAKMIVDKNIYVDSTISKHLLEYESKLKGEEQREPNSNVKKSEPTYKEIIEIFKFLDDSGVKIIGALDMGMAKALFNKAAASAWVHKEWLGFDHWKAIRSVTSLNAEALRISDKKGLIKKNYIADMVVFEKDPAKNIRNLSFSPASVIKHGDLVKANND
ncbi:amidohydrolase family protein [Dehalococcoidia bacterium]|nr:amidohydrolase family protein [Dehalococcoidia bacterium]